MEGDRRRDAEPGTAAGFARDDDGESVGGAYPGGPRKRNDAEGIGRFSPSPDLRSAEELDARSHERHRRRVRKRRRKRVLIGFLVALTAAASVGFWMGVQAHRSSQEIANEQDRAAQQDRELVRQRNKVLQQLWEMEDLENGPRPKY